MGKRARRKGIRTNTGTNRRRRAEQRRVLATDLPPEMLDEWYVHVGEMLLAQTRAIFTAPWQPAPGDADAFRRVLCAGEFTARLPPVLDIEHGQART